MPKWAFYLLSVLTVMLALIMFPLRYIVVAALIGLLIQGVKRKAK